MSVRWPLLLALVAVLFADLGANWADSDEIPAEVVPGITGHPTYLTHDYSLPVVVDGDNLLVAFLEDDVRTSSSIVKRDVNGNWSDPVRVGGGRRYDAHYYPNMVIDAKGYLHVFYGSHGDPLHYRRSSRPRDISEWEPEQFPVRTATYPRPFVLTTGEILVFFRAQEGGSRYGYIHSADNGKTWSSFKTLIFGPARLSTPYVGGVVIREQKGRLPTIHLAWSWYDNVNRPSPIHYDDAMYAVHELGSSTWQLADGTSQSLPIGYKSAVPIKRRKKFYVEDMALDELGRPILITSQYGRTPEEKKDAKTLLATFDNNRWRLEEPLPGTVLPVGGSRIVHANGWTAIVGYTSERGLIIAQRKTGDERFLVRSIQRCKGLIPLNPVIHADRQHNRFHIIATGYKKGQPGRLIYAQATVDP